MDLSVLITWLESETGLPAIFEYQNAPQPNGNFISVHVSNANYIGHPHVNHSSDSVFDIGYNTQIEVQLRCIEDQSIDILDRVKLSLEKESVQALLYSAGLAWSDNNNVVSQPVEHDGKWEHHSILEVFFNSTSEIQDDRSTIDEVEIISEV